jgi:F0F1-type ATP synthase epsilon subunit
MRFYLCRILPFLVCFGCTALSPQPATPTNEPDPPADAARQPHTANKPAAATPKSDALNSLKEAARHLDAGDERAALPLLAGYVEAHPDHATIRAHLAELLLRLHQPDEARRHLERYVADAQEQGEPVDQHLIHAETRLVEIARGQDDIYGERLHRGMGLYLLAERAAKAEDIDESFVEKTLFQAIEELNAAARERAEEPRPHWYLYLAWSQLGQRLPADTHLRRARKLAIHDGLTPAETQALTLEQ